MKLKQANQSDFFFWSHDKCPEQTGLGAGTNEAFSPRKSQNIGQLGPTEVKEGPEHLIPRMPSRNRPPNLSFSANKAFSQRRSQNIGLSGLVRVNLIRTRESLADEI
jgi:hypothetical protein